MLKTWICESSIKSWHLNDCSNRTENGGDFASEGAEAEVVAAEFSIEFRFVEWGLEDFAEEVFFFCKSLGMRMLRIFPMGEQTLAGGGIFPEEPAVFEARDVAVVWVFSPRGHGRCAGVGQNERAIFCRLDKGDGLDFFCS